MAGVHLNTFGVYLRVIKNICLSMYASMFRALANVIMKTGISVAMAC
jgi:hypothetical protein